MIKHCPYITEVTMVCEDHILPEFAKIQHLNAITVELEDCFGMGLFGFLQDKGDKLTRLSLSCGSDPDYVQLPNGGQANQLFNAALKLIRHLAFHRLKNLNISGCGLVANELMRTLDAIGERQLEDLVHLQHLLLLSYDDESPVRLLDERVLLDTLAGN